MVTDNPQVPKKVLINKMIWPTGLKYAASIEEMRFLKDYCQKLVICPHADLENVGKNASNFLFALGAME